MKLYLFFKFPTASEDNNNCRWQLLKIVIRVQHQRGRHCIKKLAPKGPCSSAVSDLEGGVTR